jgi:hypothetical protein
MAGPHHGLLAKKLTLVLVLCACTKPPETTENPGPEELPEEEIPSEYIFEEDEPEALLTLEEIETAILDSFDVLHRLSPTTVHNAYAHIRDDYGTECPSFYENYEYEYWRDSCETENGSVFSGSAAYWRYQNYQDEYYLYLDDAYYSGDAKITTPEGETFMGSGYARHEEKHSLTSDNQYQWWQVWGEFGWDGPGEEGTWIKEDYTVDFSMWVGNYNGENAHTYTTIGGGLSGLQGTINTILLRDIMIYGEELGSECAIEPYGTVSVRDDQGQWYDVVFDGPAYWGAWSFQPHCDGCGTAFFRGKEMGTACVDFTSWLDWGAIEW